jgi:excisionase family DNA binding protein
MAHQTYLREKARKLRDEKKLTIDQIAERLALSRSTIYYWVRDMPIPGSGSGGGWPEAARRKGNKAMQAKFRALREAAYDEGLKSFDVLAAREPDFRDFVSLYIAEGYKRDRNCVSLGNSDPAVVRMCHRWIIRLADNPVDYAIQYHADQNPAELIRFWRSELRIDGAPVRLQRKSNSGQLARRNWRCPYGVLTVRSGDTLLRARLEAWMDRIKASWG